MFMIYGVERYHYRERKLLLFWKTVTEREFLALSFLFWNDSWVFDVVLYIFCDEIENSVIIVKILFLKENEEKPQLKGRFLGFNAGLLGTYRI